MVILSSPKSDKKPTQTGPWRVVAKDELEKVRTGVVLMNKVDPMHPLLLSP
jgi:hypothetical protein